MWGMPVLRSTNSFVGPGASNHPITWTFVVWGLDMVGPLKKGPGGFTHLLVVVDKFTKWIEAKLITNIRSEEVVKFFLETSTSSTGSTFITVSSLTTELTSLGRSSWNSVMDTASGSTGPWSDIRILMVR